MKTLLGTFDSVHLYPNTFTISDVNHVSKVLEQASGMSQLCNRFMFFTQVKIVNNKTPIN